MLHASSPQKRGIAAIQATTEEEKRGGSPDVKMFGSRKQRRFPGKRSGR